MNKTVQGRTEGYKTLGVGSLRHVVGEAARKLAKNLNKVLSGARNLFRHKEGGR